MPAVAVTLRKYNGTSGIPAALRGAFADAATDRGNEYSLFKHIDVDKVRCLNEATPKSGARVFRAYDLRHDNTKVRLTKSTHMSSPSRAVR